MDEWQKIPDSSTKTASYVDEWQKIEGFSTKTAFNVEGLHKLVVLVLVLVLVCVGSGVGSGSGYSHRKELRPSAYKKPRALNSTATS